MTSLFEIQPTNPETYRQQRRRITLCLAAGFILFTLLLSTVTVKLFGTPGGDNFRWNLIGVLAGLATTVAVVR
ncbi:DUF3087 family protein, partial [Escherichia coli]|uniref:DUF3087 family protein n=1 Tax=Escherichia coli TaxID=562 RepID=UPI0028DE85EA